MSKYFQKCKDLLSTSTFYFIRNWNLVKWRGCIMLNVELCGICNYIFCIDFHYDSLFWINQSASQQCAPPQNLAEISQLHEWTSWNLHLAHTTYLCPGLLSFICSSFICQKAQVWNHSLSEVDDGQVLEVLMIKICPSTLLSSM